MNTVSKSFYQDLRNARNGQKEDSKPVSITRLTKSGKPSKMADDTKRFHTVEEAQAYIERIARLNPGRDILYVFNQ